jgi:hypothetical protein
VQSTATRGPLGPRARRAEIGFTICNVNQTEGGMYAVWPVERAFLCLITGLRGPDASPRGDSTAVCESQSRGVGNTPELLACLLN